MRKEKVFQNEFPIAVADRLERKGLGALPVVEIANQIDFAGVGRPFPEHPAAVIHLVQAIVHLVVDALGQRAFHAHFVAQGGITGVALINFRLEWSQVRVHFVEHRGLFLFRHRMYCVKCYFSIAVSVSRLLRRY